MPIDYVSGEKIRGKKTLLLFIPGNYTFSIVHVCKFQAKKRTRLVQRMILAFIVVYKDISTCLA